MYFKQFQSYREAQWQTGFIRTVKHQRSQNSVHLVACEFDKYSFVDQCFADYGIDFPTEIKGAVAKRKAEYLAGRIVAKHALSALGIGYAQQQVRIAPDRSPIWPDTIRGSISHTSEFAVCCVAKTTDCSFIGVDSELIFADAVTHSLAAEIHDQAELKLFTDVGFSANLATSIIFSSKESLYKAVYPIVRCFFGFEQARVSRLEPHNNTLVLSLCNAFAAQHSLTPDQHIQFDIKGALVHTLLIQ